MLADLLTAVAFEVAAWNLLLGFFLLWGLSGGDGEARNPVAPLLGFAAFGATIAAFVAVLQLLDPTARSVAGAVAVAAAVGSVAWLTRFEEDAQRRPLWVALILIAVALPFVLSAVGPVGEPSSRRIAVIASPAALVLLALPFAGDGSTVRARLRDLALPVVSLAAPAVLLTLARTA